MVAVSSTNQPMLKYFLIFVSFTFFLNFYAQANFYCGLGAGFASFDDTDGFTINSKVGIGINKYLDSELNISYAHTSDFPPRYSYQDFYFEDYWFTKSTLLNISFDTHILFIKSQKHKFSMYGGVGVIFVEAVDNTSYYVYNTQYFQSTVESLRAVSRTLGIRYTFFIKNYGISLDASIVGPIKNNDNYFGQDNFRAVALILQKNF